MNEPPNIPEVIFANIYDSIDENSVKQIMNGFLLVLNQPQKPKTAHVLISSRGGGVEPAIALYHFIKALPLDVVMHSTGSIDSCALLIFLAGTKRLAPSNSSFLIHGVTWGFQADTTLTRASWAEQETQWSISEKKFIGIVLENTTLTEKEIRDLLDGGKVIVPQFALEKGIIHEIGEVKIPQGSLIIPLTTPR